MKARIVSIDGEGIVGIKYDEVIDGVVVNTIEDVALVPGYLDGGCDEELWAEYHGKMVDVELLTITDWIDLPNGHVVKTDVEIRVVMNGGCPECGAEDYNHNTLCRVAKQLKTRN